MVEVAVRIVQVCDVLVEAEYGDTDDTLLARAAWDSSTAVENRVIIGRYDELAAAVAFQEAAIPDEPPAARSGEWHPSDMSDADYERATDDERAAYDAWKKDGGQST